MRDVRGLLRALEWSEHARPGERCHVVPMVEAAAPYLLVGKEWKELGDTERAMRRGALMALRWAVRGNEP